VYEGNLKNRGNSGLYETQCWQLLFHFPLSAASHNIICDQILWVKTVHKITCKMYGRRRVPHDGNCIGYWLLLRGGMVKSVPCCGHFMIYCASPFEF
jgi:hypothetical protein